MKLVQVYSADYDHIPVSEIPIHPEMLSILAELGVLDADRGWVESKSLRRVNKIMRLQDFLGVNLHGAIVIADLLERIERLEEQIRVLRETR